MKKDTRNGPGCGVTGIPLRSGWGMKMVRLQLLQPEGGTKCPHSLQRARPLDAQRSARDNRHTSHTVCGATYVKRPDEVHLCNRKQTGGWPGAGVWGWGWEVTASGDIDFEGAVKMLLNCRVVMIIQSSTCTKKHRIVYFKRLNFIFCKLHLNSENKEKGSSQEGRTLHPPASSPCATSSRALPPLSPEHEPSRLRLDFRT